MKEIADVVAVNGHKITLTTELKTACSGCAQQSHCGAGLLSKLFADRHTTFVVHSTETVAVGDRVEVQMSEANFTRYALLMYGMPIVCLLLAAALLTTFTLLPELLIIGLSFLAFGGCFVGLKRWFKNRDVKIQQLLRVTHSPV